MPFIYRIYCNGSAWDSDCKGEIVPHFFILIDGSTGRLGDDTADVYVWYNHKGEIKEDLLSLLVLASGTLEACYKTLTEFLDSTTIDWRHPSYMVSLSTDGASPIIDRKSGLVTLLQCLQLTILDATNNTDNVNDFD